MDSVSEVLSKAADLLEPKGAWCQGAFACNAKGEPTGLSEYRGPAVCWCVLGATSVVATDDEDGAADIFFSRFIGGDIDAWNDAPERTQAEVVAKLREASALARDPGSAE